MAFLVIYKKNIRVGWSLPSRIFSISDPFRYSHQRGKDRECFWIYQIKNVKTWYVINKFVRMRLIGYICNV